MTSWLVNRGKNEVEIAFTPARVLMQDFTGVPAVVDLAAMRDAAAKLGADPERINPLVPVDLVIDHSVMVDHFGGPGAFKQNVELEYERNVERYQFLRWGQQAFQQFPRRPAGHRHLPPSEPRISRPVGVGRAMSMAKTYAYPDTVVGTDSHTTMINGIGVLGWGVGGIEAEAAMLGQSDLDADPGSRSASGLAASCPKARPPPTSCSRSRRCCARRAWSASSWNSTARASTRMSVEDRATIANMAPEYGATCGFFPVDQKTIDYLAATGRDPERVALVEAYCKQQGLWRTDEEPAFTDTLELSLADVQPFARRPEAAAGPRACLGDVADGFTKAMTDEFRKGEELKKRVAVAEHRRTTSATATS